LYFKKDGQEFFRRQVEHPGQVAQPFLRPAADSKAREALRKLSETLGTGIEREAKKLARR
jgi:hypothetical protein